MSLINEFSQNNTIKSFEEFENILKQFENSPNLFIKGTILEQIYLPDSPYIISYIAIGKQYSNKFISMNIFNTNIEIGDSLIIPLNGIKIISVNNQSYILFNNNECIIRKLKNNINTIIKKDDYNLYNFSIFTTIYTLNTLNRLSIEKNRFLSIILKVELIQTGNNDEYVYKDIFGEKVNVSYSPLIESIEGQKIYYFNYFYYNGKTQKLEQSNYSSITELDNKSLLLNNLVIDNYFIECLKGKVISFSLSNKRIKIKNEIENKEYNLILNYDLMKKIVLDCNSIFLLFKKIDDSLYQYTNYSNIIINEETSIQFKIDKKEIKYYNYIQIDNESKKIGDDIFDFKIQTCDNDKNIMDKEIVLQKKNETNEELVDSISYIVEVNKYKINHFNLYLGEDGKMSKQYYFQSNKKEKILDFDKIICVYDDFNNEFKRRITYINIPEIYKNGLKEFNLDSKICITSVGKSKKYLHLIGEKDNKILDFDIIIKKENEGKISVVDEITMKLIDKYYKYYFFDINKFRNFLIDKPYQKKENEFYSLFNDNMSLIKTIKKQLDYKKYKNVQSDYLLIKKLLFSYLMMTNLNNNELFLIIYNFIDVCKNMNEIKFIDRIQILITFAEEIDEEGYACITLFKLDDSINEKYAFSKKAFDIFLNILDNLVEKMALFQLIHQFNSPIRKENNSQRMMYSGSIATVNDVKLDIFKKMNNFLFLSFVKTNTDSSLYFKTNVLIIYILTFYTKFSKKNSHLKEDIQNRLAAAMLIIYFNKYGGHLNTHINNEEDSPLL